jgi:hypothetical protein
MALNYYVAALGVRNRETDPLGFVITSVNLAILHSQDSDHLTRRVSMDKAIKLYQTVISPSRGLRLPQIAPLAWAQTATNLADMYVMRIDGSKADNLDHAAKLYDEVSVLVITRGDHPLAWAALKSKLGVAYGHLAILRDADLNRAKSRAAFKEAERLLYHSSTVVRQSPKQRKLFCRASSENSNGSGQQGMHSRSKKVMAERRENHIKAMAAASTERVHSLHSMSAQDAMMAGIPLRASGRITLCNERCICPKPRWKCRGAPFCRSMLADDTGDT